MSTLSDDQQTAQKIAEVVEQSLKRSTPAVVLGALIGATLTVAELNEPNAPVKLVLQTLKRVWDTAKAGRGTPAPILTTVSNIFGKG